MYIIVLGVRYSSRRRVSLYGGFWVVLRGNSCEVRNLVGGRHCWVADGWLDRQC